jgi:hypothetical protein
MIAQVAMLCKRRESSQNENHGERVNKYDPTFHGWISPLLLRVGMIHHCMMPVLAAGIGMWIFGINSMDKCDRMAQL